MLAISPALLVAAFQVEMAQQFQPQLVRSSMGLYLLFGGCMLHLVATPGKS